MVERRGFDIQASASLLCNRLCNASFGPMTRQYKTRDRVRTPSDGTPTPLARPVDLGPSRNATDRQVAARFQAQYAAALPRLPAGPQVFHGLPFDLGPGPAGRRWVLLDGPATIDLTGAGPASHVVVAHLCDTWRDDAGLRPAGLAVGHVVPVGEPLARYTVVDAAGRSWSRIIRRRFEVNDGILGWGSAAFAAVAHVENEVVDWRGPHPAQGPGRYASAGHSGSLTIMPGTYGAEPGRHDGLRPEPVRRCAPVAARHRARSRCRARRPSARAVGGGPPGQRRDRRRGDPVPWIGQPAGARGAIPGSRRGS